MTDVARHCRLHGATRSNFGIRFNKRTGKRRARGLTHKLLICKACASWWLLVRRIALPLLVLSPGQHR
jgi:hypothetical protein